MTLTLGKKAERLVFSLLIILHLLPVLCFKLDPTLDGPSHLYNSNIINNLLFGNGSSFAAFFSLNSNLEPNWLGHFLMSLFNAFLPAFLAEKIVLMLYFVTLPVSFRFFMKQITNEPLFAAYLVFPFIYSFPLLLGFINFCLSLPLLFFILGYWLKYQDELTSKRQGVLTLLFLLAYFSHLMIFLIAVGILALLCLRSKRFKEVLTKFMGILIVSSPGLILSIIFLVQKSESSQSIGSSLSFLQTLEWLSTGRPLITFNTELEKGTTSWIFYSLALLFLYAFFRRLTVLKADMSFTKEDFWLGISLVILLLYFMVPDKLFTGGFVSVRLLLLFYLFWIVWIGTQKYFRFIRISALGVFWFISLYLVIYHVKEMSVLNKVACEYYALANHIPENSVVLPLNYSDNWLHSNYSNYIGSEKKLIVLDNYEAATEHFPTKWIEKMKPYSIIGNYANSNRPCVTINNYTTVTGCTIDYVVRWMHNPEMQDSCTLLVNQQLAADFNLVYKAQASPMELFRKKTILVTNAD